MFFSKVSDFEILGLWFTAEVGGVLSRVQQSSDPAVVYPTRMEGLKKGHGRARQVSKRANCHLLPTSIPVVQAK